VGLWNDVQRDRHPGRGKGHLRRARHHDDTLYTAHPVVAISGITRERLGALAGIAIAKAGCIGAVAGAPDPAKEMKAINSILEKRYDTENRGS